LQVELRIKEEELRSKSVEILTQFPVVDYTTEKLPIERVMEALATNPNLL
jgi:ABC-2 type transport system ATP-binding protein